MVVATLKFAVPTSLILKLPLVFRWGGIVNPLQLRGKQMLFLAYVCFTCFSYRPLFVSSIYMHYFFQVEGTMEKLTPNSVTN